MAKELVPAAVEFIRWQKEGPVRERGQSAVARKLGVSQPAVRAWGLGESRPEEHLRKALEVLTEGRSKAEEWLTKGERKARKALLARVAPAPVKTAKRKRARSTKALPTRSIKVDQGPASKAA